MDKQTKTQKVNRILGFTITTIILGGLFALGIWLKSVNIGGDAGIWISVVSSAMLSNIASIPLR